ncbi:hypothetical protein CRE_00300 [Caenorhabditis remanei]|uniref:Uncharacterized protein n=1 Tax=Caenorhabditis remanei TaxID=31234 RepID=E3LED6_CAERE|nr:hypothetical protein CRE_00300 [Caenorhabditis remanei]
MYKSPISLNRTSQSRCSRTSEMPQRVFERVQESTTQNKFKRLSEKNLSVVISLPPENNELSGVR